jgi:hypothetical protein
MDVLPMYYEQVAGVVYVPAYSSKATRWTFMTRYKGRNKTKLVERDFPHHVDMMVPEFGFGTHLDAMYD